MFKVLDPTMDSSSGDTRKPADQKVDREINLYLNILGLENNRMVCLARIFSNVVVHRGCLSIGRNRSED